MDRLWSPWRYAYLKKAGVESAADSCVFCRIASEQADQENLVVFRGDLNYVVLNRYPYTNGHALIVPYRHGGDLAGASPETLVEMMALTRGLEAAVKRLYRPDGINIGMNVGRAAGAGIAGHIHMHVVPRWFADANFMTSIGETRMLPEELAVTFERLRDDLARHYAPQS